MMQVLRICEAFDEERTTATHRQADVPEERTEGGRTILFYPIVALTTDELWSRMRAERDRLLLASDRLSLARWADRWATQSEGWRADWTTYRQALRDLPETYAEAGPLAVTWPDPP